MKLLLDQNLSPRLCDRLRDVWTEVVHVRAVGLAAADDSALWTYAEQHGFTIVSKDLSGQVKTGHLWTGQNRPFPATRDRELSS
ncbi:MAG: DUF5615 family PIN-like protein, partial [Acidobacteria bacterium]|nr:DUF5615 family PIN-like protein [Acidobacteriota bacterium]